MTKLRISDVGSTTVVFWLSAVVFIVGLSSSATYGTADSGGFGILAPKHIRAERLMEYLSEVGVGTVSRMPGTGALLVTGKAEEVAKAKAVFGLVDAPQAFAVRKVAVISQAQGLPTSRAIAEKAGNILVGTFDEVPAAPGRARAIVDVHRGSLMVIAPVSWIDRVVASVQQLLEAEQTERTESVGPGPVETGKIEPARRPDANEPNGIAAVPKGPGRKQPRRPGQAPAASMYRPAPLPNEDQVLQVKLPEKLQIINLLGLVGEYLKLNFMFDPAEIKGEVTLMLTGDLRGPLKVGDLYPLLESVLRFKGFAMTRQGNLVTVVPVAKALAQDPKLVETEKDRVEEYGDVVVTRVFKLEHIDPASAQNLLSGMNLGTNISPIPDAGVLFVTGYAYRMPRVERLLKMIDKPGRPKRFRFRQLQYTMASALAPKVKTLAEQLGTVSITVGQTATTKAPTTVSPRRPGETSAQYAARVARERASRTQPARPSPTGTAVKEGVYLDADERTNRILMIGFDDQLDIVEELIDTLDVAQTDLRTLKLYRIEHVDAEQVRNKLQELGIIGGGGVSSPSASSRITGTGRVGSATKAPTTTRTPTTSTSRSTSSSGVAPLVEEPQVVIIESTNSLLVNATAEQHKQIQTILEYVDAQTDEAAIPYVIYPLENQKPEDLATILEKLIQETIKDKEGKIQQVIKKTEEDIVIVPDENTFSIIVYASKKNQEWISNLIETLDKRRPQVLIDVTLVEVTKNDKFEYDLNLIQSFPDLISTSGLTGSIVEGKTSGDVISDLLASGRDRYIDLQSDSGAGTGFYADRHINALLKAMQTKDYGRVLAKPKILVNDNETGTISTTDTTYVTKTSSIPVTSGTGGQQSTLIQTEVDYEGYDAGIQLEITPHISEGQLLRLEISLTRSDFGTITGEKPPDTTSSDLNTTVTVPDGATIILGGMIKLNQGKGGSKVPVLGDLPLVGPLFRGVSNSDLQRRLYVFVKAEIIRPAETLGAGLPDLEKISERNRAAFEKFEREFQSYQSFPGIKPKPVAPLKVLDAE